MMEIALGLATVGLAIYLGLHAIADAIRNKNVNVTIGKLPEIFIRSDIEAKP